MKFVIRPDEIEPDAKRRCARVNTFDVLLSSARKTDVLELAVVLRFTGSN